MLNSRPFHFPHDQPREDVPHALDQLMDYRRAVGRVNTAPMKDALAGLRAALETEHPSAKLTADEMVKIGRGEMELPDHIRAAGPVVHRSGGMVRERIALLEMTIGTADAHNEALDAGLHQLGPKTPEADTVGASNA